MRPIWRRIIGSALCALANLVFVSGRTFLAEGIDATTVFIGLLAGTAVAYRAWPGIETSWLVQKWRRR